MSIAKVIVVGDVATGKTSVVKRYAKNNFSAVHKTTIACDFSLKTVDIDGVAVNVQLWDIAGQDRFLGLSRVFYTHAAAAVVVYDLFQKETLLNAFKWKQDIDSKVFLPSNARIPVILIGNKADLLVAGEDHAAVEPCVTEEEAERLAQEHGFLAHFQCSAKTGDGVKSACLHLLQEVASNHAREAAVRAQLPEEPMSVTLDQMPQENGGGCCS